MENRGRVVTKAMLLEQLWDIDGNFVDDNTVRVNIKRLRQKLHDEKQEYIVTVLVWVTLLENDDEAFWNLQKTDFNYRYCYGGGICWCVLFLWRTSFSVRFLSLLHLYFMWLVVPNGLSAQPL